MICTGLNDLYYDQWLVLRWMIWTNVEWFILRLMICTLLNDLYSVEWLVLRWTICTKLNDLYYVEKLALHWIICTTLKDLYKVDWFLLIGKFVLRWMICTALKDLYYVESSSPWLNDSECDGWFVQNWTIWITTDYWVSAF